MLDNLKQFYNNHIKLFRIGLVILIVLVILLLIYVLERYIIYNILYYFLFFLHINLFSLKLESILLSIYLHIILARLIILSIVFPLGGFFKKAVILDEFGSFINMIFDSIENLIKSAKSNDFINSDFYIQELNEFRINNDKIKNFNYLGIEQHIIDVENKYNIFKSTKKQEAKDNLKKAINEFSEDLDNIQNMSFIDFLFKFKSKETFLLMENYMLNYTFPSHIVEKINIGNNFDIYLLTPKKIGKNNDILAIFCNQNALSCEFYSVYPDNIYYYLNKLNCPIIIWNYKGFGLRTGFTTFGSVNKDVEILSNYIIKKYNKYKIIIHGCSIGGYSSIKLAQKLSKLNIVLISDRTFGDIKDIVKSLPYNKLLSIIYSILFPKWYFKYRNIDNYIDIPIDKKIILFDAKDEVIPYEPSSLFFGLTQKYYNEKVKPILIKYKQYSLIKNNFKEISEDLNCLTSNDDLSDDSFIFFKKLYKNLNSDNIEKFLMFFIIFAYPFNSRKEIYVDEKKLKENYTNVPQFIKDIIGKNKYILSNKIIEFISAMNFMFIRINLKCDLNDDEILNLNYNNNDANSEQLFSIEKNHVEELKKYLGYVHRITCGHDGQLTNRDFDIIIELLKKNKFL